MKTKKIKEIDQVIEYLKSIDYYSNKTEENVKKIFIENISLYKENKISISFLTALCSELLYFNNNIGAFYDINLRNFLLKGDQIAADISFDKLPDSNQINNLISYSK